MLQLTVEEVRLRAYLLPDSIESRPVCESPGFDTKKEALTISE
jgi:hypothetical protein